MPAAPDLASTYTGPPGVDDGWNRAAARGRLRSAAETLTAALFVLEHGLAPTVFIDLRLPWDSHFENDLLQRRCHSEFVVLFGALMERLDTARSATGLPLSAETGILISSELGRFPLINSVNGKDHWPEFTAVLMGPGVRPGQYGVTDKMMQGSPISFDTGRAQGRLGRARVTIDDLGATVLAWFGLDEQGLRDREGRVLGCLLG